MVEFNVFWSTYPADLCHKKKGVKSKAEDIWNKYSSDKQDMVLLKLRELMRHGRQEIKAGGNPDRWPFVTTWLNQERWNMLEDIESYQSLNEKIAARKCECGRPVDIAADINLCWNCYYLKTGLRKENDDQLLANLKALGLSQREGESRPEWNARCYQWVKSRGGVAGVITRKQAVHD